MNKIERHHAQISRALHRRVAAQRRKDQQETLRSGQLGRLNGVVLITDTHLDYCDHAAEDVRFYEDKLWLDAVKAMGLPRRLLG